MVSMLKPFLEGLHYRHSGAHASAKPQMRTAHRRMRSAHGEWDGAPSALVGVFARGDLLDQLDDAAPKLGIGDPRERAG